MTQSLGGNASSAGQVLISYFSAIHPLSENVEDFLSDKAFFLEMKKGKFLRTPLEREEKICFILKGVVRGFVKDDGTEVTTWISEEDSLVGSIRTLGLENESAEYLQVLEDARMVAISRNTLEELYDRFPEANIIGRKVLELYYRDAEERAFLGRLPSAEKRYVRFMKTRANLTVRISLKYIASYLGIKLETLSRIRSGRY